MSNRMDERELTKVEVMVMKVIWSTEYEMSLGEILEKVNLRFNKSWKSQTISTYLARLVKKKFLLLKRAGRTYTYEILIPKDEYMRREMATFADVWGNHSPAGFVSAFNKENPLTEVQKQELRYLLDELD